MVRIVIADDQYVVRAGLLGVFSGTDIEIAVQAVDCAQAVKFTLSCDPDAVLLDVSMPDGSGLSALEEIMVQRPGTKVIFYSAFDNIPVLVRAYELGASGYIEKGCERKKLLEAIHRVSEGKRAWTRPPTAANRHREKKRQECRPCQRIDRTRTGDSAWCGGRADQRGNLGSIGN